MFSPHKIDESMPPAVHTTINADMDTTPDSKMENIQSSHIVDEGQETEKVVVDDGKDEYLTMGLVDENLVDEHTTIESSIDKLDGRDANSCSVTESSTHVNENGRNDDSEVFISSVLEVADDETLPCDLSKESAMIKEDDGVKAVSHETTVSETERELERKEADEKDKHETSNECDEIQVTSIEDETPDIIQSSPSKTKMKFQFVSKGGKFTLQVVADEKVVPQESNLSEKSPTTPKSKSKSKPIKSGDGVKPQRTKSTDKSIGGKTRNKVMSPRSPKPGNNPSASQKPLMDLRHILKKYEKKKEPLPQQVHQVDFYGSMSAIPFLTSLNKTEGKKSSEKNLKKELAETSDDMVAKIDSTNSSDSSIVIEKPRLPTKEEIVVTAEYDEAQLKLWKSMTALDCRLDPVQRPQEMLPLRPGIRKEKKKFSPNNSAVRAFSRPDDWLSHPEWNASQKSYRSTSSKEQQEEDFLVMEPDE